MTETTKVASSAGADAGTAPAPDAVTPRMKTRYADEIAPALLAEFSFGNVMQVPRVTKVIVNMGVGEAARDAKLIDGAVRDVSAITGLKPIVT